MSIKYFNFAHLEIFSLNKNQFDEKSFLKTLPIFDSEDSIEHTKDLLVLLESILIDSKKIG